MGVESFLKKAAMLSPWVLVGGLAARQNQKL